MHITRQNSTKKSHKKLSEAKAEEKTFPSKIAFDKHCLGGCLSTSVHDC